MPKPAERYAKLIENFRAAEIKAETEFAQDDLRDSARAIFQFEKEHKIPELRQLLSRLADSKRSAAVTEQQIQQLRAARPNVSKLFGSEITFDEMISEAISLLAIERLVSIAPTSVAENECATAELLDQKKALIRSLPAGTEAVLLCDTLDKETRESFGWLIRELEKVAA